MIKRYKLGKIDTNSGGIMLIIRNNQPQISLLNPRETKRVFFPNTYQVHSAFFLGFEVKRETEQDLQQFTNWSQFPNQTVKQKFVLPPPIVVEKKRGVKLRADWGFRRTVGGYENFLCCSVRVSSVLNLR